jgi:nicotinate-nucleotide adenylyltransferase
VIIGEDNLASFEKWKNYQIILEDYGLYVYPRLTDAVGRARPNVQQSKLKSHPNVTMVDAPLLDISATFIRKCIRNNQSIRYLVPDPVEAIIRDKKFYIE